MRDIEYWKQQVSTIDLDTLLLYQRDYVKFGVSLWNRLVVDGDRPPKLTGVLREALIAALVEIYDAWQMQLAQLAQPYYLKIWLMLPDISRSQVVCAIDDQIRFYEDTFFWDKPKQPIPLLFSKASQLQRQAFQWQHGTDEALIEADDLGRAEDYVSMADYLASKRWMENFFASPHRICRGVDENGNNRDWHFNKINDVWVGERI